jgi:hypothetical protein
MCRTHKYEFGTFIHGNIALCTKFLACKCFCRRKDKNSGLVFSISQMFHNSCELLNFNLGLGPAVVTYIVFLFNASTDFMLELIYDCLPIASTFCIHNQCFHIMKLKFIHTLFWKMYNHDSGSPGAD